LNVWNTLDPYRERGWPRQPAAGATLAPARGTDPYTQTQTDLIGE